MRSPRTTSQRNTSASNDAVQGITKVLISILTIPARVINFLTTSPGSAIMLGLGVLYFAGVSSEGYWQAMSELNPAFMPKPFINDEANLLFILVASGGDKRPQSQSSKGLYLARPRPQYRAY